MTNWKCYNGSDDDWDLALSQAGGATYLQGSRWSKHLANLGWECCRWHYQYGGTSAFLQGFLKRYPLGFGVIWFPDWIVGEYEIEPEVMRDLRQSLSLRHVYIRIRSHHVFNQQEQRDLQRDLTLVKKPFDTATTMHLDLTTSVEELHQGLSKNWRRNLKRSTRFDYEMLEVNDVNTIIALYAELSAIKGVGALFSEQEIASLMQSWQGQIIVIGAKTDDGKIQAIRGAIIYQNRAIDIFAAANALARKHYLSYALCWELLLRCQQRECRNFDFNGVDSNNMGVYNFKKGTGAELVKTLGEFEYASNPIIKHLVNFAAKWHN